MPNLFFTISHAPDIPLCLLVWEERDADGQHVTWRFSLQDAEGGACRIKNLDELTTFLERWMEIDRKIKLKEN